MFKYSLYLNTLKSFMESLFVLHSTHNFLESTLLINAGMQIFPKTDDTPGCLSDQQSAKTNAIQLTSRTRTVTRLHITNRCEADCDNKDTVMPIKGQIHMFTVLSQSLCMSLSSSLHSF